MMRIEEAKVIGGMVRIIVSATLMRNWSGIYLGMKLRKGNG